MTKWKRLVKESNDKISFEEFIKMFEDYCEAVNEYYVLDGFKSENKEELRNKIGSFKEFVADNVSDDYKREEPNYRHFLEQVFHDLEDDICDADGDYANSEYVYNKIRQLYYDFMNFKSLAPVRNQINESIDEKSFKKLLKQNGVTKLPSGTQFKPDRVSWSKDGGYAGEKTIERMRKQVEDAGWNRGREMDDAHPDGSWVARGDVYVSPDGQIEMSYYSHYGATSYDNSFSITFKLVGGQVNEADDESDDDFANSDRPQIYRYYDDDETPLEDFVKHVHSVEQDIEDTFIQNSDVYENADDPWELFCDDMHGENLTLEESLDLDYYMNNAAYEQLPEDIKKYVYRSSGSCDFDSIQWLRGIFERLMPICKDQVDESSRFGFNVGDMVELTKDKSNTFTGETVKAGTQGEVVAVDKPMPGVIKVGIEGGKVISVPERQLKKVGEDEEPWRKLKAPEHPKRDIRPERPEDYYMRPTSYGSPRYTGD